MLMWRQFTQWLGGMGIIVLALAVLPRLRVGGRQLLESEMPGPEIDDLANRIRSTAQRLWLLYVALTAAQAAILAVFGWTGIDDRMDPFNAVAHAFTTLPDRRLLARAAIGGAVQRREPVGDRRVHGSRRDELRAPLPRHRSTETPRGRA